MNRKETLKSVQRYISHLQMRVNYLQEQLEKAEASENYELAKEILSEIDEVKALIVEAKNYLKMLENQSDN